MRYRTFAALLLVLALLASAITFAQQRLYGTSSTGGAVPILVDSTGALLISSVLTAIAFEGTTDDAYETSLTVVDPTADHTITLPDSAGYVPVFVNANTTDVNLVFEGATADDHETTIAVTDPTGDHTITFPASDITAAEFLKIVGITNGTGAASKALVLDANADITAGLRNIVGSGDGKFATYHVGSTAGCDGTPGTATKGIVTSCTGPETAPDALLERIQYLETQVAALLAQQPQR